MKKAVFTFLAKNWKGIAMVGMGVTLLILIISRLRNQDEKEVDDQIRKQLQRDHPQVDTFQYVSDASSIHQAFGLGASWFNPTSWTEDEDAVIAILQKYTSSSFKILEDVYYEKFGRYLEGDIRDFFRESQLEQIGHLL